MFPSAGLQWEDRRVSGKSAPRPKKRPAARKKQ